MADFNYTVTRHADLSVTVKCPACGEEQTFPWDRRVTDLSDEPPSYDQFVEECEDEFDEEHFCDDPGEDEPDDSIDDDFWEEDDEEDDEEDEGS